MVIEAEHRVVISANKLLEDVGLTQNLNDSTQSVRKLVYPYKSNEFPFFDLNKWLNKKQEARLLNPMMQAGLTCASELLSEAGLLEDKVFLDDLDLIVANGAGTRDEATDFEIVTQLKDIEPSKKAVALNKLISDAYRPTEFLKQLPNLLASNICIMRGINGSSRTLLGGMAAGFQACDMAVRSIASGRSVRTLVGGVYFGQCFYQNLILAKCGLLADESIQKNKFYLSSSAGFTLMEDEASANERGANIVARVIPIKSSEKQTAEIIDCGCEYVVRRALEAECVELYICHKPDFFNPLETNNYNGFDRLRGRVEVVDCVQSNEFFGEAAFFSHFTSILNRVKNRSPGFRFGFALLDGSPKPLMFVFEGVS